MKRFLLPLLLCVLPALPGRAQTFEPRDSWPFLYEEFLSGATRTMDGSLTTDARFNVSVIDGSLLYIGNDDIIMKPDMTRVYTARLGNDVYVNIMGRMYQLLSELDCGLVVLGREVDRDELNKVSIGYGKSAVASTQSVSLIAIDGGNGANKSLESFNTTKYNGKVLPVKETYYLRVGMRLIPATRQELLNLPGIDKKAATAFFKQEKIKWRETASLEKVLVFVNEQLSN